MLRSESSIPVLRLREWLERAETSPEQGKAVLPFGLEVIDRHLLGGGLALGRLHECMEGGAETEYAAAATLFVAGIPARLKGPVLWCLHGRDLFAPALARVGLHPDRVIYCETGNDADVLPRDGRRLASRRACARSIGEVIKLPLNASRRLQLAAEQHRRHRAGHPPLAYARTACASRSAELRRRRAGGFRHAPARTAASTGCRAPAGRSNCCARAAATRIPGFWRLAMRRVISLFLPRWPTDRLRRKSNDAPPPDRPLVTAARQGQRRILASVDEAAAQAGLAPGMTVTHAQSLVAGL